MADGTPLKTLDDTVKLLSDASAFQTQPLTTLKAAVDGQLSALSDLVALLTSLEGRLEQALRPAVAAPTTIHLDFPRFDGTKPDPLGWIFKADIFFKYYDIHGDDERLQIASFHMDGRALQWCQWMHRNGQTESWEAFKKALEIRFGPSEFEDNVGQLCKLTQQSSVTAYQSQFENLAYKVFNLPPSFLVSCFISGLRPDIRAGVSLFSPKSLSKAIGLAKLQEAKPQGH